MPIISIVRLSEFGNSGRLTLPQRCAGIAMACLRFFVCLSMLELLWMTLTNESGSAILPLAKRLLSNKLTRERQREKAVLAVPSSSIVCSLNGLEFQ